MTCKTDCGRCVYCTEHDDYGPAWRNPLFQPAASPDQGRPATETRQERENVHAPALTHTCPPNCDPCAAEREVIADLDDPEWADVQHNTQTLDCMGADHAACLLPEHCQCVCHGGER